MGVKLVIEPIFEADFCDSSYGFRPKKSAPDAVHDIGYASTVGTPMSLMPMCPSTSTASRTRSCWPWWPSASWTAASFTSSDVAQGAGGGEDEDGTRRNIGGGKANTQGTPQGGVISPLLAKQHGTVSEAPSDERDGNR